MIVSPLGFVLDEKEIELRRRQIEDVASLLLHFEDKDDKGDMGKMNSLIEFKDGRLVFDKVSVKIPNGFYLNGDVGVNYRKGIILSNATEDIYVDVALVPNIKDIMAGHKDTLEEGDCVDIKEPREIEIDGLNGYSFIFEARSEYLYETHLRVDGNEDFIFLINASTNKDLMSAEELVSYVPLVQLIESIKKEN